MKKSHLSAPKLPCTKKKYPFTNLPLMGYWKKLSFTNDTHEKKCGLPFCK